MRGRKQTVRQWLYRLRSDLQENVQGKYQTTRMVGLLQLNAKLPTEPYHKSLISSITNGTDDLTIRRRHDHLCTKLTQTYLRYLLSVPSKALCQHIIFEQLAYGVTVPVSGPQYMSKYHMYSCVLVLRTICVRRYIVLSYSSSFCRLHST